MKKIVLTAAVCMVVLGGSWTVAAGPGGGSTGPGLTTHIATDTDTEFRRNITSCEFAEYFRSIGEPELGGLLTCGVDFAVERRTNPDWTFTRTQTLMLGADYCDFCWTRNDASDDT